MSGVTLIGYHFPKTGGTTIHAHATEHLGDRHYAFGFHNDSHRLYGERPLLPEYPADKVAEISFVFGHGVDLSTLRYLPGNNIELFAVCRHPVARFVSSYKHFLRTRRDGPGLSPREYFRRQPASPFAHNMLSRFGRLADDNAQTDEEKLISILRGIRFILATEHLTEQSAALFAAVETPPVASKRRVYLESIDLQDLTEEEILTRERLDLLVFEAVSKSRSTSEASKLPNPFGYEPERLAKARATLADEADDVSAAVQKSYFDLFTFHQSQGRIHATKLFLDHRGLPSARQAFAAFCQAQSLDLDFKEMPARNWCYLSEMYDKLADRENALRAADAALAADSESPRAHFLAGRAAARARQRKRAVGLLAKAVELNPAVPDAWYWLARVSWKIGDKPTTKHAVEQGLRLNLNSKRMKSLAEKVG
jgi:tetratricopeptide (TPR) repeat protein